VALPNNTIPGTAQYTGKHDGMAYAAEHLYFNGDLVGEGSISDAEVKLPIDGQVDWYDFRGLGRVKEAVELAQRLGMPPLALEDALDVHQRPKYEERAESALIVAPHLSIGPDGKLIREQITIFWTSQFVLTLQEYPTDAYEDVRERIRQGLGRVRQRATTYLAYALVDTVVDGYANVVAAIEEEGERIEDDIFSGRRLEQSKRRVHALKRTVNELRRTLLPLREAVGRWLRSDAPQREPRVEPFLRDLFDNVARDHDTAESLATRTNDLYQLYTSELAVETNKIVQVLTVVSAIFIPLTFLAGLYGMNFTYIPELQYRYGYFVLLGVMLVVAAILLMIFRRRGWL